MDAEVTAVSIDNNGRKKKNKGSKNMVVRALQRGTPEGSALYQVWPS